MHHLTSLLTNGVFDRHPGLRVMMVEWGFTWMPWVLWSLDAQYAMLRKESPAVRQLPSESFRAHVRTSSQPWDYVEKGEMRALLDSFEGIDELLCFSTDYPHYDADEPGRVANWLPACWHSNVFYENADRFFDWRPTVATLEAAGAATPPA